MTKLNPIVTVEVFMTSKTGPNCNPPKVKISFEKHFGSVIVSGESDDELNFQKEDLIKILEFLKEEKPVKETFITYGSQPSMICVYPFDLCESPDNGYVKHKSITDALFFLKSMGFTSPYIRFVEPNIKIT